MIGSRPSFGYAMIVPSQDVADRSSARVRRCFTHTLPSVARARGDERPPALASGRRGPHTGRVREDEHDEVTGAVGGGCPCWAIPLALELRGESLYYLVCPCCGMTRMSV